MKKHKLAERIEQRQIRTSICVQPGCQFKGKPAVQGVCHTSDGEIADFAKMEKYEAELVADMKQMRRREGKEYIRALESHYMCAMVNWTSTLDECVRLRRNLALATAGRKIRK